MCPPHRRAPALMAALTLALGPACGTVATDGPTTRSPATAPPTPAPLLPDSLHDACAAELRIQAAPLRSLDPETTDDTDLATLARAIGTARVVVIGEIHGDANSYLLKTRLIRYLHRHLGFTLLAFESPLFEGWQLAQRIAAGCSADEILDAPALESAWRKADELRPLARLLLASRDAARPLRFFGVDPKLYGSSDQQTSRGLSCLQDALRAVDRDPLTAAEWAVLHRVCILGERTPEETRQCLALGARLATATAEAQPRLVARQGVAAAAFVARLALSVTPFVAWANPDFSSASGRGAFTNPRDQMMADHLLWRLAQEPPGTRAVLWTGGFHTARGSARWDDPGQSPWPGMVTVADVLRARLGEQVYTIGIGARAGQYGRRRAETVPESPPGSLENLMDTLGTSFAFLDLRGLPAAALLRRHSLFNNAIQPRPIAAVLPDTFDGYLYLRDTQMLASLPD